MGTDKRIRDLAGELLAADLETLKASLTLVVDDASFTTGDAKKVLLATLLNSAVVADDTTIDSQALTPKGFNASVSTTARKGIVKLADETAITSKTGDTVLTCGEIEHLTETITAVDITINSGNKSTYVETSGANVTVSTINMYFRKIGKMVFVSGYLGFTGASNVSKLILVFKQLPIVMGISQQLSCTNYQASVPRPVGTYIYQSSQYMVLEVGNSAPNVINGDGLLLFNGFYLEA